jgi:pilus assembly protein TadC
MTHLWIYLFIVGFVLFVVLAVTARPQMATSSTMRELAEEANTVRKRPLFFKVFAFLLPVTKVISKGLGPEKIANQLARAGLRWLPEEFVLVWMSLFAALFFFAHWIISELLGRVEITISIMLIMAGIVLPRFWLSIRAAGRKKRILRTLPDAVDLVAMCVNAGLDFSLAVKWVVDKSKPGPLVDEFSYFLLETKVGKTRRQALKDMAKRVELPEMNSFTRALTQAERLGAPIESALNRLADDIRDMRFRRAEKEALLAPLKMLVPLIFFIMPVVAITVGGPVILQFLSTGFTTKM